MKECCLCGKKIESEHGHNAQPLAKGFCCRKCNWNTVIPERIKIIYAENTKECCLCGKKIEDEHGHNAQPVAKGFCCSECNWNTVIPERINRIK